MNIDVLSKAVALAATIHKDQLRKDGKTPYISHPVRVSIVLRELFQVSDHHILAVAILHDVIEDSALEKLDLEKEFGTDIGLWVSLLSKDKALSEAERENAYCLQLRSAPVEVKLIKLADIYDNVSDAGFAQAGQLKKTLTKSRKYLESIKDESNKTYSRCFSIVDNLIGSKETFNKP